MLNVGDVVLVLKQTLIMLNVSRLLFSNVVTYAYSVGVIK